MIMGYCRGFQHTAKAAEVINVILVTELKVSLVANKEVIWSYNKVAFIAIIRNQREHELIPDMTYLKNELL